jgi:hypothetical protein
MAKLLVTQRMLEVAKDSKSIGVYTIEPDEFLKLTINTSLLDWLKNEEQNTLSLQEYNDLAQRGKIQVMPFLDVDMNSGKVLQHEGRHRAAALIKENAQAMDVAIVLRESGHKIYYRQPNIDDMDHPRQYEKVFLNVNYVPPVFRGEFLPYRHSFRPRFFKDFYPSRETAMNNILSRLKETANVEDQVKMLAKKVFGPDVQFDPSTGLSITSGEPHLFVLPKHNYTLREIKYFGLAMDNNPSKFRVNYIMPDKDKGPLAIKVTFFKNFQPSR